MFAGGGVAFACFQCQVLNNSETDARGRKVSLPPPRKENPEEAACVVLQTESAANRDAAALM